MIKLLAWFSRRKGNGRRGGRRKPAREDDEKQDGMSSSKAFLRRRVKLSFFTVLFATAVVFICFYGQAPPATRSLLVGTIAPKSVYSDQTFSYESAEKVINERKALLRDKAQYDRHKDQEARFIEGLALFEKGLSQNLSEDDEGLGSANLDLANELRESHEIDFTSDVLAAFSLMRGNAERQIVYQKIQRELDKLHTKGVLKNPSEFLRFHSEDNATKALATKSYEIAGSLLVIGGVDEGLGLLLLEVEDFPHLNDLVQTIRSDENRTVDDFSLSELASEGEDLNATNEARDLRQQMASAFTSLAIQGLVLREYNEEKTETVVNREMEVSRSKGEFNLTVKEGERIIHKGHEITPEAREKYTAFLEQTGSEETLFPRRILLTCATFLFALLYINLVLPEFWRNDAKRAIVAVAIVSNLLLSRGVLELGGTDLFGGNPLFVALLPYLLPVAFAPIVVMITVGPRMAALSALMASVFHAAMAGSEVESLAISLGASLTGAFFCRDVRLRKHVLRAGAFAGLVAAVLAVALGIATGYDLWITALQAGAAFLTGVMTGALVTGVLPMFENMFKVTTEVTLLELTDYNHPILRRMQMDAPGTYHHSLMVATLSENAALAVGGNPLLCRTCSLYHDIGKMVQPEYFTENQGGQDNPHLRRNPSMSALIIKSHVKEGVEMARRAKLPEVVIDVIKQHHGTSLVRYFYYEAVRKSQQTKLPLGEKEEVDESTYRYDGPRPRFKESAIIFFADAVEATSRSLKKVTSRSVEEMLDSIFAERLDDGQLDECALTLEEIKLIKKSFSKTILNMLHARIEYPELEKENGKAKKAREDDKAEGGDK